MFSGDFTGKFRLGSESMVNYNGQGWITIVPPGFDRMRHQRPQDGISSGADTDPRRRRRAGRCQRVSQARRENAPWTAPAASPITAATGADSGLLKLGGRVGIRYGAGLLPSEPGSPTALPRRQPQEARSEAGPSSAGGDGSRPPRPARRGGTRGTACSSADPSAKRGLSETGDAAGAPFHPARTAAAGGARSAAAGGARTRSRRWQG